MRMCRTYQLVTGVFMFLSACGGGAESNKDDKAISQPAQETSTDQPVGGPELFSKYGCFTCHSLDGNVLYGPPLNDLYMKEVSVVSQGEVKTIIADRDYLARAITDPDYEKVLEYKTRIMPKPEIPKEDVEGLIDYLIGLGKEK